MASSSKGLLLLLIVLWWGLTTSSAWGLTAVGLVTGFLIFWFFWASSGMDLRRKLQIATWAEPAEGCIHAKISLDATKVLDYIERKREQTKKHITITHVVGKAMAYALRDAPGLNGRIVLDRFVPFPTIDVSFLTVLEGGRNLAKVKVCRIDEKSLEQISDELDKGSTRLRKGADENFKKSMGPIKILPTWLIRPIVAIAGYASAALGLSIPALGLEPYPFGGCLITSVGMLGVDEAYAPFTPFTRVAILVLIGAVHDGVKVDENGKDLKVCKKIKITATIDHRFLDGAQGGVMAKVMRQVFDDPDILDK